MAADQDDRDTEVHVAGHCPMGCGDTLVLSFAGQVVCSWLDCPRPGAVDELLADQEIDHQVTFDAAGFTIRHPLRERLDDELVDCRLHKLLAGLDAAPMPDGRYRALLLTDDVWSWSALS